MTAWTDALRRQQGAKAMRSGHLFEEYFERRLRLTPALAYDRMPDGCRTVGRNRLIRVKTPYDWILTMRKVTALLDTKTFDLDRLLPSKIEPHQLKSLISHAGAGAITGYVIHFRKSGSVCFASAQMLSEIVQTRKGMPSTSLEYLGLFPTFDVEKIFQARPVLTETIVPKGVGE